MLAVVSLGYTVVAQDRSPPHFPGTKPLVAEQPLDEQILDHLHRYCLRQLAESPVQRHIAWKRDYTSVEAYQASIEPQRTRFQTVIGAVDPRITTETKKGSLVASHFELVATPAAGLTDGQTVGDVK